MKSTKLLILGFCCFYFTSCVYFNTFYNAENSFKQANEIIDNSSFNYNVDANTNDGSCVPFIYGCTDSEATNYESNANTDNGSCYFNPGCMDAQYLEYYSQGFAADFDNGSCITTIYHFAVFVGIPQHSSLSIVLYEERNIQPRLEKKCSEEFSCNYPFYLHDS